MEKLIPVPTMKDFLWDDLMKPFNISSQELANAIGVSENLIKNIIADKAKVDADLSIRLGKYFNMSEDYFVNLQIDIDKTRAKRKHANRF